MMKTLLTFVTLAVFASVGMAQSMNMTLEANWDDSMLPASQGGLVYNDCWGYNAANGTEVAILGTYQRIYFFDVTDPTMPEVIDFFDILNAGGTINSSTWRDMKTYDHYCYAAADVGTAGLQIFDLQYVPDSVVLVTQTQAFFNRAHNIWIDEAQGRLYSAGGDGNNIGTVVLDLNPDPANPTEIGSPDLPLGYIHDIHVIDNIAYASHGNMHALCIYDFADPEAPVLLKTLVDYPEAGYNHSAWIDASGNKLVFADETHGKGLKLINPNISEPQTTNYHVFRSQLIPNNTNSIAHNPFILDDLAIVAYYHDGVQVFDISDTSAIERIAYYDTYSNTTYSGYEGCWGVYPFLESGYIIASDIENGLFVLSLNQNILPLEFIAFDAVRDGRDVALTWKVTGPQEKEYFVVEHSKDGITYLPLGELPSLATERRYEFIDHDPGPGVHYYRITMVHRDGTKQSTAVRTVVLQNDESFRLKATLTNSLLVIDVNHAGQVSLVAANGTLIMTKQLGATGRYELHVGDLPAGQYFVSFSDFAGTHTEAIIKQ